MALTFGKLNFSTSFNPTSAFPLDARQYFESLTAAQAAAATAVEAGSAESAYYFGMPLVVYEGGTATFYIINGDGSLKPAGGEITVDGKSIVIGEDGIALDGFAEATTGQQPRIAADGTLEWYTPDTSTVSGLQEAVGQLQTDVDALEATVGNADSGLVQQVNNLETNLSTNYDTSTEVDDKIDLALSSVYKAAGSAASIEDITVDAAHEGDVYNMSAEFTTTDQFVEGAGHTYPAGTNVVVIETNNDPATYGLDVLAGFVDLSGYATTEALTEGLAGKVDKVSGSSLVQDALITKLQGLADIQSVATGELEISAGELGVVAIEQSKITGLTEALAGKADATEVDSIPTNILTGLKSVTPSATNVVIALTSSTKSDGTYASGSDVSVALPLVTTSNAGLMNPTDKTKLDGITAGAEPNLIDQIQMNGVPIQITEKAVNIPIATNAALGVVMGSTAENKAAVGSDGTLELNSLNVLKLVQTSGDQLILDGGNSSTASA